MSDIIDKQAAIETALEFFVEFLGGAFYENSQKELIARFQRLPSAQQWIPCSERLPKKEYKEQRRGVYLTTNGYGVVGVTNYEFEGDFGFVGWGTNRPYDIQIVAWMPLPEPWKGEEE